MIIKSLADKIRGLFSKEKYYQNIMIESDEWRTEGLPEADGVYSIPVAAAIEEHDEIWFKAHYNYMANRWEIMDGNIPDQIKDYPVIAWRYVKPFNEFKENKEATE